MIITFKHKALRRYFEEGDSSKLNQNHLKRLRLILAKLHSAEDIKDMRFPGSDLHHLGGDLQDFWSVRVNANWRIIFHFAKGKVYDVDYIDYH
jgi:toxin HigB-1